MRSLSNLHSKQACVNSLATLHSKQQCMDKKSSREKMARASLSQSSLPLSTPNENEEERKGRGKVIPCFRVSLPAATWLPPIRHGWDGLGWDGVGWDGVG